MSLTIKQGDAYSVPVKIAANGSPVSIEDVERVEFRFGEVRKLYPEEAEYDPESGEFRVPLSQEDTLKLPEDDAVLFDVRVKFKGGTVVGTRKMTPVLTADALSGEVI